MQRSAAFLSHQEDAAEQLHNSLKYMCHLEKLPVPEKAKGKSSLEVESAGNTSAKKVELMPL